MKFLFIVSCRSQIFWGEESLKFIHMTSIGKAGSIILQVLKKKNFIAFEQIIRHTATTEPQKGLLMTFEFTYWA